MQRVYTKMRGEKPTIQNINLELDELVLPVPLLAEEESLSPDADPEEEEQHPFSVDTYCYTCKAGVRFFIVATASAVRTLQQLLFAELNFVCTRCSKQQNRHGRP